MTPHRTTPQTSPHQAAFDTAQTETNTPGTPAGEPASFQIQAGARPLPDYVLVRKLGEGGFGQVWLAQGPGGFEVALKFIKLGEAACQTEMKAMQMMKGIRHAHLLSVFGVWEKDDWLIVAMELADRSLLDRLKEATRSGLPGIPPHELLEYMKEAAKGLDILNERGIIHRDVKPHNLFLSSGSIKVADYGLAKVVQQVMATVSTKMTPAYASPEIIDGKASPWSDQYSLAVTYCQLRTNQLPFQGSMLELIAGHVVKPPDLTLLSPEEEPVVARALAKVPQDRWANCREFVHYLEEALSGRTVEMRPAYHRPMPATPSVTAPHFSRPNAPTQEPAAPTKSRGTLWFMVALWSFILLVVGGVALFVMLWNGEGEKGTKKNAPISALTAAEAKTLQESTARKLNADVDWENSIGMRFRLIPPGEFMMGSPPGEIGREANEMQYRVKIPQAFYLGTYTVTRGQFRVFVGETGYRTFAERSKMGGYIWREDQQKWERKPEYTWQNPDLAATDGFPVVIVTWSDAQEFCNWLSRKEGRTYRLPTEAEWEYACRAGTTTRYHSGDEDGSLADYAWTAANSGVQLHSVGKKRPNAWGLFDMHGNVWQWCQNRFDEDYSRNNPAVDLSQERIDTRRVVRGGSWLWVPSHCRSAHRYGIVSGIHDTHTGFRVYCEISRR